MLFPHLSRSLVRTTAALLTAAGLLAGIGASAAATPPSAPRLKAVEATSSTTLTVRWQDTAETEDGFRVSLYVNGTISVYMNAPKVPGKNDIGAWEVPTLKPNTRYCVDVKAFTGTGQNGSSTFSESDERLCGTTLLTPPPAPDLTVTRISGQPQLFNGESSVYEVVVANLGGPTTKGLYLLLRGEYDIELVGMENVPAGFNCATTTTKYEERPFLKCTGALAGTESHPSQRAAVFQVRVRGVSVGDGTLSAYAGAENDADASNANHELDVKVK